MDFAVKYGYTPRHESNKGVHHHDQLPRDPEAEQPRTQQYTNCAELHVLPNRFHSDTAFGTREGLNAALAGGTVRQTACRDPVPVSTGASGLQMPDYEYVHKELQKSGVTLNLLWLKYCEVCQANGEIPYQLTQFKKYYRDYMAKTNATMHLNHKPGEILQVDWAGDTASRIPASSFRYTYS